MATLGQFIARRRKEAGLTQLALASESEITRNYVAMIENGERCPTLRTLRRLASVLRISLGVLDDLDLPD